MVVVVKKNKNCFITNALYYNRIEKSTNSPSQAKGGDRGTRWGSGGATRQYTHTPPPLVALPFPSERGLYIQYRTIQNRKEKTHRSGDYK